MYLLFQEFVLYIGERKHSRGRARHLIVTYLKLQTTVNLHHDQTQRIQSYLPEYISHVIV
jgi:hypothetical protein